MCINILYVNISFQTWIAKLRWLPLERVPLQCWSSYGPVSFVKQTWNSLGVSWLDAEQEKLQATELLLFSRSKELRNSSSPTWQVGLTSRLLWQSCKKESWVLHSRVVVRERLGAACRAGTNKSMKYETPEKHHHQSEKIFQETLIPVFKYLSDDWPLAYIIMHQSWITIKLDMLLAMDACKRMWYWSM